ncbi:MAG: gluconokinase [Ktedonobacterales bacterium]
MAASSGNTAERGRAPYVLALDIGTSSVRALLYDATGADVHGVHIQHTYPLIESVEGEVAVDADALVAITAAAVDEALAAAGPLAGQIAAVATDTFWHSFVAVDASGKPLTPVITWADTRPRAAAADLVSRLDARATHQRTGAMLHASYWPAKLRWLQQTQPEIFASAAEYLSFGEYLHRQVLGRSVCSLCMASGTGLLRTRERVWDDELLGALGLRREQLPALGDLRDAVRGLAPRYSERWPALRETPWYPALGDGAAANIGSGCTAPQRIALTVGTSSALRALVPLDDSTPPEGLWLYLLDARRGVLGGALSEGGNLFAWMEATLRVPKLAEAEAEVAKLAPAASGVTVLPYLAGERSLGWHGEARATFAGIGAKTTPNELLRAGIEALAYRISAVYERLARALNLPASAPQVIGSGGALLGSPLFQQTVADVLGVPLYPSRDAEASARGAALLALEALGILPDVASIPPNLAAPIQPDLARQSVYRQAAARQEELYRRLLDGTAGV